MHDATGTLEPVSTQTRRSESLHNPETGQPRVLSREVAYAVYPEDFAPAENWARTLVALAAFADAHQEPAFGKYLLRLSSTRSTGVRRIRLRIQRTLTHAHEPQTVNSDMPDRALADGFVRLAQHHPDLNEVPCVQAMGVICDQYKNKYRRRLFGSFDKSTTIELQLYVVEVLRRFQYYTCDIPEALNGTELLADFLLHARKSPQLYTFDALMSGDMRFMPALRQLTLSQRLHADNVIDIRDQAS